MKFLVRMGAIVIPKNPKGQVAGTSRLLRRSLGTVVLLFTAVGSISEANTQQ